MSKAAKIFIWIGMIIQFFLIFPIVIGVLALNKINQAKSKNELQTLGVLTTLFCSALGGVFMLCIKDEELVDIYENTNLINVDKQSETLALSNIKKPNRKNFLKFIVYSMATLLSICLVFSIIPTAKYHGGSCVPLIINVCQILLFVPITIMLFLNKHIMGKVNKILLIIFTLLSLALIVLSIITNYYFAYYIEYSAWNNWNYYIYGESWEYWIVFGLSVLIAFLSVTMLIVSKRKNKKMLKKKPIKATIEGKKIKAIKETKPMLSKIEIELNEVKRLYENNVVTEEEYKKMRASVISKYYR